MRTCTLSITLPPPSRPLPAYVRAFSTEYYSLLITHCFLFLVSSRLSLKDSLGQGIFARYSSTIFFSNKEGAMLILYNGMSSLAHFMGFPIKQR